MLCTSSLKQELINGSLELAKQLVDVAAQAGADAAKFQTFMRN